MAEEPGAKRRYLRVLPPPPPVPAYIRFWQYVEKTDGCWLWRGATTTGGYGVFGNGQRVVTAHRWVWEALYGPIEPGLQIDHLCRVILCVNPTHLDCVTALENVRRSLAHRARVDKSVCARCRQEPRSPGQPYCRDCRKEYMRDRKRRLEIAQAGQA